MSHVDEGTLHAYLDGELSSGERATVDAHLGQCATCRAALAEARSLLERASAMLQAARPAERPVPPFEQLRRSPRRSSWAVRPGFAWAASITVALGLGYYLRDLASGAAARVTEPRPVVVAQDRVAPTRAPESDAARATDQQAAPQAAPRRRETAQRQPPQELARNEVAGRADTLASHLRAAAPALESTRALRDTVYRLEGIVVTATPAPRAAAAALGEARELTGFETINRSAARTMLGTDPVGIPGVAIRSIRRSPDGAVVVEQALDSATVIRIFQRPASAERYYVDGGRTDTTARAKMDAGVARREPAPVAAPAQAKAAADRLARFVGRLRVEISGPLPVDSLNRLLELVEPLP